MSTAHLHAVPSPEKLVELYSEAPLPTRHGLLRALVFRERATGKEHVVAVKGDVRGQEGVLVRVHSECLTSEILGSLKCDCREQLEHALHLIGASERGAMIYLRQEGRGIGLGNKIRAYDLQNSGADTVEANEKLGFEADARSYDLAAAILADLDVKSVRLMTNNPRKRAGLEGHGLQVVERVPLSAEVHEANRRYLETKRDKLGHLLPAHLLEESLVEPGLSDLPSVFMREDDAVETLFASD